MDDNEFKELYIRPHMNDDASFVRRITAYAFAQTRPLSLRQQISLLWDEIEQSVFIPTPALTFAILALFGFAIGALSEPDPLSITPLSVLYETREMI